MRRHKRDKESRAFSKGYQAGLNGRSRDICPYAELASKQNWINGWRQGRQDLVT